MNHDSNRHEQLKSVSICSHATLLGAFAATSTKIPQTPKPGSTNPLSSNHRRSSPSPQPKMEEHSSLQRSDQNPSGFWPNSKILTPLHPHASSPSPAKRPHFSVFNQIRFFIFAFSGPTTPRPGSQARCSERPVCADFAPEFLR